jgi:GTPase SAR1 family protein
MSRDTLKNADAAIILFDMCNKTTLEHVSWWASKCLALSLILFTNHQNFADELRSATHNSFPIVICGNKADKAGRDQCTSSLQNTTQSKHYDISALNNSNFEEPWLYLFREIFKDPNLVPKPYPIAQVVSLFSANGGPRNLLLQFVACQL